MYEYMCAVASVVSNSVWPCGLQPARLLCSWDSPGKNTRVGSHFFLQQLNINKQKNKQIKDPLHIEGIFVGYMYVQGHVKQEL